MNENLVNFFIKQILRKAFLSKNCINIITDIKQNRMCWAVYVKGHEVYVS